MVFSIGLTGQKKGLPNFCDLFKKSLWSEKKTAFCGIYNIGCKVFLRKSIATHRSRFGQNPSDVFGPGCLFCAETESCGQSRSYCAGSPKCICATGVGVAQNLRRRGATIARFKQSTCAYHGISISYCLQFYGSGQSIPVNLSRACSTSLSGTISHACLRSTYRHLFQVFCGQRGMRAIGYNGMYPGVIHKQKFLLPTNARRRKMTEPDWFIDKNIKS